MNYIYIRSSDKINKIIKMEIILRIQYVFSKAKRPNRMKLCLNGCHSEHNATGTGLILNIGQI